MNFQNKHLSYSRINRFSQCPLSFQLHYIKNHRAEPSDALRFGKAIHAVLEVLVREHMEQERFAVLSEDRATDLWQQVFASDGLSGVELFQDGLNILIDFVREQGVIDHQDVLAVEKEFHLPIGPFDVLGYIDRVDRVDDETIEVIDYKTNRMIYTHDEVDSSLQMSLYHLAAQQIWPWAKKVRLTFHMLRHGIRQVTERTSEKLNAALKYVETIGKQTETATEFPARLNTNCIYCDHKRDRPAYVKALTGQRDIVCDDANDLELVAKEREEVSRLSKILYQRKRELEEILKSHLLTHDELVLGGVRYRMFNTTRVIHPLDKTIKVLERMTDLPRSDLFKRLAIVDNKALDTLIKQQTKKLDRSSVLLLKAELEAISTKSHSPRFWGKEVSA